MRRMAAGFVGILSAELHFPENGSLKGKRKELLSVKAQLQRRFGASVAEVDHHELWQRARITLSCVARGHQEVEQLLDGRGALSGTGRTFELGAGAGGSSADPGDAGSAVRVDDLSGCGG